MGSTFPTTIDTFPTVLATTDEDDSGFEHDVLHNDVFDALLALETKLGEDGDAAGAPSVEGRLKTLEASKLKYWRDGTPPNVYITATGSHTILTLAVAPYDDDFTTLKVFVDRGSGFEEEFLSWSGLVGTFGTPLTIGHKVAVEYWTSDTPSDSVLGGSVQTYYDAIVANAGTNHWFCFDVNDLSTLYSDTGGTTPISGTVGDVIKAIANKGPDGGFATSSTGAALAFDSTSNLYYFVPPTSNGFQFTGIPSALLGGSDFTMIAIGDLISSGAYSYLFQIGLDSDGTGKHFVIGNGTADGGLEMLWGGGGNGLVISGFDAGAKARFGTYVNSTKVINLYNGSATSAGSRTQLDAYDIHTNIISLGDYITTNAAPLNRFYSMVMLDRVVTSTERSFIVTNALLPPH